MVKGDIIGILSLSFLGFFSIPTVKFRLKPQLLQQPTKDGAELQGCSARLCLTKTTRQTKGGEDTRQLRWGAP